MKRLACGWAAVLLLALAQPAAAAQRYVSDELRVSVRTGKGDDYRIIEVLPTGTAVETLEQGDEWARVRTPDGKTGWMRSQYLQAQPVAEDRLRAARSELEAARGRVDELEQALAAAKERAQAAGQRIEQLQQRNAELERKVAQSQKGLELAETNERLEERVAELERKLGALRKDNAELADRDRKQWFAIGAGVLLGGMLIGIVVTRVPWRSRRDRLF